MHTKIGDLLLHSGLITEKQLEDEMSNNSSSISLGLNFIKSGIISEEKYLNTLSSQFETEIINLDNITFDDEVLNLIPYNIYKKYGVLPISKTNDRITVAMVDPSNIAALNDIKFITGLEVNIKLASPVKMKATQEKLFDKKVSYESIIDDLEEESVEYIKDDENINLSELEKQTEDAPVVKLVNAVLTDAIKKGASDIHIEPYEKAFRVRFRIDGVLYEIMKLPINLKNAITSRIKIMASLDIAERRLPQDGRIKLKLQENNKEMDFRVNVVPTLFGEKVCLRLLDPDSLQLDMTKLGFTENQILDFKDAINKPFGMVLVTGPTGSGKTTTLYSALSELNQIGSNISTAEDPVEFNLMGINQCQINEDIGFDFASALRAFLRQDPDIIMVGEIRDYETAQIAIKASLTGHLVLSTLHTNDAPSTINRLIDMGVEPFLVASSTNLILAQRLARKICSNCKVDDSEITKDLLLRAGVPKEDIENFSCKRGVGCDECSGTGYKGRIALYEVMPIKEEISELILKGANSAEIKKLAKSLGMLTLRDSALLRLKEGLTSFEEVVRVTSL
ncbi:MAG: type IV-A pilus assembly ATPase PilB [Bdellovibrionota bacterium]